MLPGKWRPFCLGLNVLNPTLTGACGSFGAAAASAAGGAPSFSETSDGSSCCVSRRSKRSQDPKGGSLLGVRQAAGFMRKLPFTVGIPFTVELRTILPEWIHFTHNCLGSLTSFDSTIFCEILKTVQYHQNITFTPLIVHLLSLKLATYISYAKSFLILLESQARPHTDGSVQNYISLLYIPLHEIHKNQMNYISILSRVSLSGTFIVIHIIKQTFNCTTMTFYLECLSAFCVLSLQSMHAWIKVGCPFSSRHWSLRYMLWRCLCWAAWAARCIWNRIKNHQV